MRDDIKVGDNVRVTETFRKCPLQIRERVSKDEYKYRQLLTTITPAMAGVVASVHCPVVMKRDKHDEFLCVDYDGLDPEQSAPVRIRPYYDGVERYEDKPNISHTLQIEMYLLRAVDT